MSEAKTTTTTTSNYQKVSVLPEAFVSMLLHARRHPYQAVHGVLLGSAASDGNPTLTVQSAVPICHVAPVQPWIETSLALIEAQLELYGDENKNTMKIVGWYTAPLLLQDVRPGPVALRMASILESSSNTNQTSALIVLNNQAVAECCQQKSNVVPSDCLQVFGKDFGNQYQEKIASVVVSNSAKVVKALQEAIESKIEYNDFVDHLEGEASTIWYPNKELVKLVEKVAT